MALLEKGTKAPDFKGFNQDDELISLSDFKGKKLILYFYPKDNTSGCTSEACNLNDNYVVWQKKGYEIVGISPDTVASHKKFVEKYGFDFDLLSDSEHVILEAYGVWAEKNMYGRKYMGVLRTTYIIDENGIISDVFAKVKTNDHSNQILKSLEK